MSVVSLLNVDVLNNPAKFTDKYRFEITFECLEQLSKDLEFKLTYVGSANSSEHDQELDSLLVGPIPTGVNKFLFEADPPNLSNLPSSEILGVTVILLTGSYDGREFVRVGYYVNNEYDTEELNQEPPKQVQVDRIVRNMLTEKPRVTRFAIKWDNEETAPPEFPPDQPEADLLPDDEDKYAADEAENENAEGGEEEDVMEEDTEMGGAEGTSGPPEDGYVSDVGSEDLEAESEGEDDDEAEGDDDDDEMDTDADVHVATGAAVQPATATK